MKALNSTSLVLSVLLATSAIANADDLTSTQISPVGQATVEQKAQSPVTDSAPSAQVQTAAPSSEVQKVTPGDAVSEPKADLAKFKRAEAFIDPTLAISRSKAISDKRNDVELAKLRLEEASIESQIAELGQKSKGQSQNGSKDDGQMDEIAKLRSDIEAMKQRGTQPSSKATHDIYVTKIFGVDGDFVATIYYNNNVYKKHVGETIVPGMVVERIDINGISIKQNGKVKSIALTQSQSAFEKAFDKKEPDFSLPPSMTGLMTVPENTPRAKKM